MNSNPYFAAKDIYQKFGAVVIVLVSCWLVTFPAFAGSAPLEVKISLGSGQGELKFFPSQLDFIAGQKYKLILDNPSPTKHYFTAKDFADASWTQKVEAGKVEIKGAIHELELKPNAQAEWVIVPLKTGKYKLICTIPGHAEAGMVGEIAINNP
ncbi:MULTISPECIES: cupredoxin domain-containing protein [unclassified Microcystis]|uniref:Biphenyl 2,3-dioxygenase n=1 Tax=Microcystis flos-aquae Mf_QC_C_20070823_S10D TaxID=2486236 RepID=A0A552KML8_9CHRO|nr:MULTISPECIES: cupredoxin domain-containing protein [unclassified Microcystis]MCA2816552.1 cupredoxin domain-containing protein [Microcystis sp. M085S1]MCA2857221.1 cupredoxin domain-containing protein [Microcystis sp. M065S1]TRT96096.1 MAG: biphenyl 2,3-dioxygenase [Microcystis flos-aquae Ma_QC_C_20070823_S18D]TRV09191.1 MAG: biphenyl 2,3-dioxygenase [Microcystis flos-aquae Mf_QC_C_20070823_S10D]TRV26156.1 MAG: biphenyl 2,3-dioxygenase [Microcystis flos-aquae Mf_QC_C_20070823_S10]TRV32364.